MLSTLSLHNPTSPPQLHYSSLSFTPLSSRISSVSSSLDHHHRRLNHKFSPLRITNSDAIPSNNNNSNKSTPIHIPTTTNKNRKLKIGIVGFGNFGQFLAKTLIKQGHTVLGHSKSDYTQTATKLGVSFFTDPHDFCEEHPEVILLCTSILSTKTVLSSLPLQRLKRNTLFVDVLSVKEFPRSLFLETLPQDFDILCTHPMFGPESGANGWNDLAFVYEKVRVGESESRVKRCDGFIDVFRREGCRMVEISCVEHDKFAGTQFLTHMMGRVLQQLELESTPINTKGYESLLNLVENTSKDSFELFYGLFLYNKNAMDELRRLDMAFETVKNQLCGRLHTLFREQSFKPTLMLPSAPQSHPQEKPQSHPQEHQLLVNGVIERMEKNYHKLADSSSNQWISSSKLSKGKSNGQLVEMKL